MNLWIHFWYDEAAPNPIYVIIMGTICVWLCHTQLFSTQPFQHQLSQGTFHTLLLHAAHLHLLYIYIYIYICYHVEVTIINFSALKNSSFHSAYSHPYQWLPLQYLCWCCLCSLLPLQATSTRTLTSHGVMAGPRYSTMDSSSPSPLTRPLALASSPGMNICLGRLTCSWNLCLVTLRALSLPTM